MLPAASRQCRRWQDLWLWSGCGAHATEEGASQAMLAFVQGETLAVLRTAKCADLLDGGIECGPAYIHGNHRIRTQEIEQGMIGRSSAEALHRDGVELQLQFVRLCAGLGFFRRHVIGLVIHDDVLKPYVDLSSQDHI